MGIYPVFLFLQNKINVKQAINEGFVEDINAILNTGDLPNLYVSEEKASILENMINLAKQMVNIQYNMKYF